MLGGRPVGSWPAIIAERLLPPVVGRALAHEIGHFVLGSKDHTRSGLMAAQFPPDLATFAGRSAFRLSAGQAGAVRLQCLAGTLDARGPTSRPAWLTE
jgi:hypothetical protein